MNPEILNIEKIQQDIENVVSAHINPEDGHQVKDKLQVLSSLLSSCSKCIQESKRMMLVKRKTWLRQHAERISEMSPSIAKEFVNTATIEEEILLVRCEKNYSAIVHSIDALRSILSILKAEMSITQI